MDLQENTESLERAGFAVSKIDIANMAEDELIAEGGFGHLHAFSCWSMGTQRGRRSLGLVQGWPKRLHLLVIEVRAQQVLQELISSGRLNG